MKRSLVLVAYFLASAQTLVNAAEPQSMAERPIESDPSKHDELAVFVLQRGFYVSSDLGLLQTLGGQRGYSTPQPFVSLKGGFDLDDAWSLQLVLSHGYAANNPLSANELLPGGQGATSYELMTFGAELVRAFRPATRLALDAKLGGGAARISPSLTSPSDPRATLSAGAPYLTAGLELVYLTLLTNFTAGLSLTGYYVVGPAIIALGEAFVVRYTF